MADILPTLTTARWTRTLPRSLHKHVEGVTFDAATNDGHGRSTKGEISLTGTLDAGVAGTGGAQWQLLTNSGTIAGAAFASGTAVSGTTVASTGVDQIDVSTQSGAQTAIDIVDRALNDVNSGRATLGAFQSRFESVVSNLNLGAENATAGRSRVQDADSAVESANLAKNQVLQQAGMSVLAQANALPQQVLALLQ